MDEYLCLTLLSRSGESQAEFAARLSRFWTHMLRQREADFEKVYAETTSFEQQGGLWRRQYLVEEQVIDVLHSELAAVRLDHEPVDRDDVFSRYEAASPEWMQIEH